VRPVQARGPMPPLVGGIRGGGEPTVTPRVLRPSSRRHAQPVEQLLRALTREHRRMPALAVHGDTGAAVQGWGEAHPEAVVRDRGAIGEEGLALEQGSGHKRAQHEAHHTAVSTDSRPHSVLGSACTPRADISGSSARWQRPLYVLILQHLACTSAPRPTMPAPPRTVRATIVVWENTEGDWLCGLDVSQGADVGQRAAYRRAMPLGALAVFRRGHARSAGRRGRCPASPQLVPMTPPTLDAGPWRWPSLHAATRVGMLVAVDRRGRGRGAVAQGGRSRVSGHG
jgi:hypothetical protein